jgi:hypothetical protein
MEQSALVQRLSRLGVEPVPCFWSMHGSERTV